MDINFNCIFKMELQRCILALIIPIVFGYSTYPRRYTRDSDWGDCPSQCQCVTLNSRGPRDLFSDWASDEPWYTKTSLDINYQQDSGSETTGRSMICQGLRQLPTPLPKDVTKMVIYGDSSHVAEQSRQRDSPQDQQSKTISDTQLRYIDRHAFRGNALLRELILSGNNIGVLYPFIFHGLRNLNILSIQNNNVQHLSAAVFNGLSQLQELKLSDNKIRFLPSTVFTYLVDMKALYLNGNKLRSVQKELFSSMTKLEKLDLSRNNISDFYDEVFDQNMALKELLLDGNRLWMIRPRWFKNLYALQSLSIRGNEITQLYPDSFMNLMNLQDLLLSANHISLIHAGAFRNLQDLKVLDLSTNDLPEVSKANLLDLNALKELYLSSNRLTNLENKTFEKIETLIRLDVSRNDIGGIEQRVFSPLRQLQYIDISHNKLQKIVKGIFTGLKEIKELKINDNFVSVIENEAFNFNEKDHLSKLSSLNLANNNLKRLSALTFRGIPNLKVLNVENNKLRRMHSMAFVEFTKLASLSLRKNKIKNLNNGIFHNLKHLIDLDISENKVKQISSNMFIGLDNLEELDIGKNQIRSIDKDAFKGCPNAVEIDLQHNMLISFNFTILEHLPQIATLDLSNNQLFWVDVKANLFLRLKDLVLSYNNLQTMSKRIVNLLGSSSLMSIQGNPWKCDCNLGWIMDPSINKRVKFDMLDEAMCKTPSKLHGWKISDLTTKDFTCKQHSNDRERVDVTCNDGPFNKKTFNDKKAMNRKLVNKHVTVYDWRNAPVSNGILVAENWALVGATALDHVPVNEIIVKIGHGKLKAKVMSVIKHPLLSLKMQNYDIALLQLGPDKINDFDGTIPCFLTQRQFKTITKIIPRFTVTARIRKGAKSKLKIRKGKLVRSCKETDYLCSYLKKPKQKTDMLLNGSPLYVGHQNNLQLAGIGLQPSLSHDINQAKFIPLWKISDWVSTVMQEYNKKCHIDKKNKLVCSQLNLPHANDLYAKMQHKEIH
ncbi:Hypothetical predicted protein [Mytilus galloprovincialis]|uniref:LRRCT domain-containing protein n=2 Tax=Mytilus galloprovincialis TaxID=29158 RepID=A0A8B6ETC5_MYTGA|nr:Hypothetical predicted protein [Mytilus galloprovincialis]